MLISGGYDATESRLKLSGFPAKLAEKTLILPAFALSWRLNWPRITNGERVIEDFIASPELDLLQPQPAAIP